MRVQRIDPEITRRRSTERVPRVKEVHPEATVVVGGNDCVIQEGVAVGGAPDLVHVHDVRVFQARGPVGRSVSGSGIVTSTVRAL